LRVIPTYLLRYIKLIALLFYFTFLFSCIDKQEFDFSKLSLSNINPTWVVPLVSDSIGLKTGEYIEFNGDSAVLVLNHKFNDSSLLVLDSLFNLPQQKFEWEDTSFSIPVNRDGEYEISFGYKESTALEFPKMKDINTTLIRIDSIFLDDLDIDSQPIVIAGMSGKINITLFSLLNQNNPFNFDIPFPSTLRSYHYNNYVLRLIQDSIKGNNVLKYKFNFTANGTLKKSTGSQVKIGWNAIMKKIKISKIFTYIGKQTVEIKDTFHLDIKGIAGNIQLKSLDVKFEVDNSIGIPVALNLHELKLITPNGAERKASNFKPIYIKSPSISQLHTPVKTIDSIDGAKLIPLFGDIPNQFCYSLSLVTNPRGEKPGITNFLLPESKVELTAHIKAPLNLSLQDVVFSDTLDVNLSSNWRKMIDDLFFRLKVVNHFPIAVNFQATLLDEYNLPIGNMLDEPLAINAGKLNITTSLTQESASISKNIPFNKFKLDQLQHTKRIFFTVKANTSGNGAQKVKIGKKDFVVFKLGVSSKIHLNEVF
jgi:hypothetical protein